MPTAIRRHRQVNPWAVLIVLSLGTFMTLLDLTIVNVAIPSLSTGLGASLDQVLWVLNAYSLGYAVLLITTGRLGDVFGPRNLFAAGLSLFTVASALSGLAQSPTQLILARALQGVGAALLAPQGLPIMLSLFPPHRRAGVFAVFGILAGLAVVAGPTLGGVLVTHFGWRSIFYVNLPVGVLVVALAFVLIPDLRPGIRHRLDLVGVLLATAGLLGVVFGLIEGERYSWGTFRGPITIPMIIAAGVALLVGFLVHQYRRQGSEPLLPFAVFQDRNFSLMTLVMATMGFSILGVYLPLTIYLQSVLGLTALEAGLTTAAQPLAMLLMSGVASALVQKVSPKYLVIPGLVAFAAGIVYLAGAVEVGSSRWVFLPGLITSGLGMAFIWTPVYALATRDLRPDLGGVASGVINTIQELGGVIASAALGALLQNRLAAGLHDQAVARAGELPEAERQPFVDGFANASQQGLGVGAGQAGAPALPPGLPEQVARQIQVVAHEVFSHAFVAAMRPTMLVPVAVILLTAVACLWVRALPPAGAAKSSDEAARPIESGQAVA
ncbi:MAG: DHA2 family efflux MFS transporter permease subunit [Candidatus Dormibacteraeota bacterium]|nr:DHA2 family efflux MFS transporter permease subunit [Candidatus Dormibacteraeota bacterium]